MAQMRVHLRTVCLGIGFSITMFSLLNLSNYSDVNTIRNFRTFDSERKKHFQYKNSTFPTAFDIADLKIKLMEKKIERLSFKIPTQSQRAVSFEIPAELYYNVHIFYYSWYRCPPVDKKVKYWNNEKKMTNKTKILKDVEPTSTNYYPKLGFYSSRNATVIDMHMRQIRRIGAGVIAVAWYPAEIDDSPEDNLSLLMDTAAKYNIKIALHIKSYSSRSITNLLDNLRQFIDKFQHHKALYRYSINNRSLPVFYIFDPQDISSTAWREILKLNGEFSIRGTKYDGIFIGLLTDLDQRYDIKLSKFDGFYTYFASNGMTYGATWKNWNALSKFANENNLIFIPCVSPGYSDGFPDSYTRHRHHGNYFDVAWRSAMAANPKFFAITSFNAWNEGSQIEPAIPRFVNGYRYVDYEPERPDFYLNLSGWWISKVKRLK